MKALMIVALLGTSALYIALVNADEFAQTDKMKMQGTWEVVSVQRAGRFDTGQVGGQLTIGGNTVNFAAANRPRTVMIDDGTS